MVDVLTEEEIARILKACDPKAAWGMRAHAMLTLMLDSGLRSGVAPPAHHRVPAAYHQRS